MSDSNQTLEGANSSPAEILTRAEAFIWRNARLVDRHLFAHLFHDGPREPVLATLRAYQNADGGFGNALEPDKRDPHSQPVDCEVALHILDDVDGFGDPMVTRLCDFLLTITTPEGGIPFALPSVRAYPRAPWWEVPDDPPAAINPTAAIAGLLLKHGVSHPWVETASTFCWQAIEASDSEWFHELVPMVTFLEYTPDRERAARELQRIVGRIEEKQLVALDPNAEGYVFPPLLWAPTPQSYLRRLFSDDVIATHLDALIAKQQPDGGWPISWEAISPAVELEWRGWLTVRTLDTLRAYGRLEG
jgi:hypothetical protein